MTAMESIGNMSEVILLSDSTQSIRYLMQRDKRISKVINMVGPISYKPHEDSYRFLVDTIIGQMLSNKVADVMSGRLSTLCNGNVSPDGVSSLSDEAIRSVGIAWSKVSFIRNLTSMVQNGQLDFSLLVALDDNSVMRTLTSIHGIGTWSAKMYLIFVLNRENILPFEDGAFLQGYRWAYNTDDLSVTAIKRKCAKWSPYSSIAARYLYKALDMGLP